MPCKMVELCDWDPSVTRYTCFRLSCKVHKLTLPWVLLPRIISCRLESQ
jgi:hypothetical protein